MADFYRAFEDRYRGSRELIKDRLKAYLPFLRPLYACYPQAIALDLGCGRGEWLELLAEEGFKARGVDLDQGMLAACKELNLDAELGDALATLKSLPSASLSLVSAFHVVEHIEFDGVMTLIAEARRVLLPGGLLILETPNPENLVVATSKFYLDPTHEKPIPPMLLSFAAEYVGFERVKIVRLQESADLHDQNADVHLIHVFEGVSLDYSIVAQNSCDGSLSVLFDEAFAAEYGMDLGRLINRYEASAAGRLQNVIDSTDQKFQKISDHLHQLDGSLHQLDGSLHHLNDAYHQTSAQLQAVYTSTSWRVTAPLRSMKTVMSSCLRKTKTWFKTVLRESSAMKYLIRKGIEFVSARPRLRGHLIAMIARFPRLYWRLKAMAPQVEPHTPMADKSDLPLDRQREPGDAPDIDAILERIRIELSKKQP